MKKGKINTSKIIPNTPAERKMLQEVIEKMKDIPAFEDKKKAILECIDVEKSKQGVLKVSFV